MTFSLQRVAAALFVLIGAPTTFCFHVHCPMSFRHTISRTASPVVRRLSEEDTQVDSQPTKEGNQVNGASLVFQSDGRSTLASAFSNLAESDQYDAVLTGLCAKILDDTTEEKVLSSLQDPVSLVQEMNGRNVQASGRSLMAFVDVSEKVVLLFTLYCFFSRRPILTCISFFRHYLFISTYQPPIGYSQDTGCSSHDQHVVVVS